MKLLFESWRNHLDILNEQLLIEGRIDDVEKKYPHLTKDNLLDVLIKKDPSGNQKYLAWAAKNLSNELPPEDTSSDDWRQTTAQSIADEIIKYHQLLPYVRDEDAPYKDINNIKGYTSLRRVASTAYHKKQRREQEKEQERQEKQEAMQNSEIIINDDDFMMVRPTSAGASCYWGKGTRWCISAAQSQNYFNSYTGEGKAFYFLASKNRKNFAPEDWEQYQKIALVYENNEFSEAYDASDSPMNADEVQHIVAINLKGSVVNEAYQEYSRENSLATLKEDEPEHYLELVRAMTEDGWTEDDDPDEWWQEIVAQKWYEIEASAQGHVEDNPAGPGEEEFAQIEQEADLQHTYVSYDEYEPGRWYWSAGMSFDFDDLEWGEDNMLDEHSVENEITSILDDHYIYPDELEIYNNEVRIDIRPSDYDEQVGLEGFQNFVNSLSEADGQYEDIRQALIDMFVDEEVIDISTSPYGQLRSKAKATEWEYFRVDTTGGTVQYRNTMTFKMPEIVDFAQEINRGLESNMSATGVPDPQSQRGLALSYWQNSFSDHFIPRGANNAIATNVLLDELSGFFRDAQIAAATQLDLPGIPAAKVEQIVTPAAVRFYPYSAVLNVSEQEVTLDLDITVGRDVNETQLQAVGEFAEYFDKNYEELHDISRRVVLEMLKVSAEKAKEEHQRAEALQEEKLKECGPMPKKRIRIRIERN